MNFEKELYDCVGKIIDDDIRKFTREILKDAPLQFWAAPSSSSGKKHPPEDNIYQGLVVHTIKAFYVARNLFKYFGVYDQTERDIIMSSIILHDIYKNGNPWSDKTDREHGKICADKMYEYNKLDRYIRSKIQQCVRTHMSRWAYPIDSLKEGFMPDKMQMIVSLSDYIASRNDISFYPGTSILSAFDSVGIKTKRDSK